MESYWSDQCLRINRNRRATEKDTKIAKEERNCPFFFRQYLTVNLENIRELKDNDSQLQQKT